MYVLVTAVQQNSHLVEWLIILTNVFVGGPTLFLAILTMKEAHKTMKEVRKDQKQERKLIRRLLLLLMPVSETDAKHRG